MSLKVLIALLFLGIFAVKLFRSQADEPARRGIFLAGFVSAYELLHRQNFGILVSLIVVGFALYAWRNWFVSLCATMILMAFLENRDTPHSLWGLQGLNPWNFMMLNVLLSWWVHRRREGVVWDMPRYFMVLSVCYLLIVVWSYGRLAMDFKELEIASYLEEADRHVRYTFAWVTSEYLINCVKWLLPAVLLYDACRTRQRAVVALGFVLLFYFLVAIQVIQCMPLHAATASAGELARIAGRDLDRSVGYFRTELSMMLAGASWAILSTVVLMDKRRDQLLVLGTAAMVALAQALTGGRAGYVTWGLTGLVVCLLRWRWLLPGIPAVILAVCFFLPNVRDRMLTGFGTNGIINKEADEFVITSGRTLAWSYVIPKIEESPLIGYGRQAMIREGIYQQILREHEGETFPHPHNAYLEILLDNGIVGFMLILPIYLVSLVQSLRLLRDRSDPLFGAVGGAAAALILGLMFASIGSQSFYAKESSVGMWAAIGLMLRVYLERARSRASGEPLFGEKEDGDAVATDESVDQFAVPA